MMYNCIHVTSVYLGNYSCSHNECFFFKKKKEATKHTIKKKKKECEYIKLRNQMLYKRCITRSEVRLDILVLSTCHRYSTLCFKKHDINKANYFSLLSHITE